MLHKFPSLAFWLSLGLLLPGGTGLADTTGGQKRCLNAFNRQFLKVTKKVGVEFDRCMRDAVRGKLDDQNPPLTVIDCVKQVDK